MKIDHIQVGRRNLQSAASKINDTIDIAESVSNIVGDKFIKVEQNSSSVNIGLKINEVLKLVPERSVSGGGGSGGGVIRRARLAESAGTKDVDDDNDIGGAIKYYKINAYLYDERGYLDNTALPETVEVWCQIIGSEINLNETVPRLTSGYDILVAWMPFFVNHGSGGMTNWVTEYHWVCTTIFQPSYDCPC